jgi:hypothetical protein
MGEGHGAEHFGLGQFIGLGLHHHDGVLGARDNQVEPLLGVVAQVVHVVDGRVQDVLAILEAHAAARDRPHEGRARDRQRGGGRDHRDDVGIVDEVVAEHRAHHQHFVLEARHEQRADRPVDQARGQRLFLGRARLALEEAAGHLAGRVVFFLVVNRQGEEVLPRLRFLGEGHVRHDGGFTQRRDDRSIGLTGHTPRFQCERLFAPLHFFLRDIEHISFPVGQRSRPLSGLPVSMAAPLPPTPVLCTTPGSKRHVSDARGIPQFSRFGKRACARTTGRDPVSRQRTEGGPDMSSPDARKMPEPTASTGRPPGSAKTFPARRSFGCTTFRQPTSPSLRPRRAAISPPVATSGDRRRLLPAATAWLRSSPICARRSSTGSGFVSCAACRSRACRRKWPPRSSAGSGRIWAARGRRTQPGTSSAMCAIRAPTQTIPTRASTRRRRARPFTPTAPTPWVFLCLREAMEGGDSLLVSVETIYNRMRAARPDLPGASVRSDRDGPAGRGARGHETLHGDPAAQLARGHLTVFYQRQYIDSAQRFSDALRLTPEHIAALDLFDSSRMTPTLHLKMRLTRATCSSSTTTGSFMTGPVSATGPTRRSGGTCCACGCPARRPAPA